MYGMNDLNLTIEKPSSNQELILTKDALKFLIDLHTQFNERRLELLAQRDHRSQKYSEETKLDFLQETTYMRSEEWSTAATPHDLEDRRVEITGPVDAKTIINALNSEAKVFMADFEDATSPTWDNLISGQFNLIQANLSTLEYFDHKKDKRYKLKDKNQLATLLVRPRGWHLDEKHLSFKGQAMSASLFDFGLYFFHNAHQRIKDNSAPYFYLPKMEHHLEARLWNDVFKFSQDALSIPRGSIRATCLIETLPAAFQMEEILYELKEHSSGLNAGRWDYIFSTLKTIQNNPKAILPNRDLITMSVPFMSSYVNLLVQTCHKRGAHAIGGMAAFIPNRHDSQINQVAFEKVQQDKSIEATAGCDGTWVAHPDLVSIALKEFNKTLKGHVHQKSVNKENISITREQLLNFKVEPFEITESGVRKNINVVLQYLDHWLSGKGAVAINNLMEDAATAEISRAQLWQWLKYKVTLDCGTKFTYDVYKRWRDEEINNIQTLKNQHISLELLDTSVLSEQLLDFITIPAYQVL